MKKKILFGLSTAALAVAALASCGQKADLKTVSMFGGTDPHAKVYEQLIKEFEKETGKKVGDSSQVSDEDWKTSVVSSFVSGDEADVLFFFTGANAKPFIENNKVVSIEEIRKEYPDYAKNIPDDRLDSHAVTLKGMVEGMFVNTELLTGDMSKYATMDKWSWDDFMAVCDGLTKAGKTPVALGAQEVPHYWIEHLVLGMNGPEAFKNIPSEADFNAATGEGNTAADKWIKALKMFNVLDQKGVFGANHGNSKNDAATTAFLGGNAGMYVDGSWFAGSVTNETKAKPDKVKMIPFPAIPEELGGMNKFYSQSGFTTGFYISRKAWENEEKRDLAVKFVEKMTSDAAIKAYCEAAGGIPASPTVKVDGLTPLGESMNGVIALTEATTLPLSDLSKANTFPTLVSASAAYLNGEVNLIKKALAEYAKLQK